MFESDNELDDEYLNNETLTTSKRLPDDLDDTNSYQLVRDDSLTNVKTKDGKAERLSEFRRDIPDKIFGNVFGKNIVERRFPGPAGLLPSKNCLTYKLNENYTNNHTSDMDQVVCSQRSGAMFENELWQTMWKDHKHLLIGTYCLTERYTINWINKMAKLKIGKVPFLAAIVECVDVKSKKISNVNLTLKDMTGEIQAIMSQELYAKYVDHVKVRSVVVLANFGLLNLLHNTKHFIVINNESLLTIYNYGEVNRSIDKINNLDIGEWNKVIGLIVNRQFTNNTYERRGHESKRKADEEDSKIIKKNCLGKDLRHDLTQENLFNTESSDVVNFDDINMNF